MEGLFLSQVMPRVPGLELQHRSNTNTPALAVHMCAAACAASAQEWEREAERDGRYYKQQADGELTRSVQQPEP
jgi:hypothetical protein